MKHQENTRAHGEKTEKKPKRCQNGIEEDGDNDATARLLAL